VSGGAFNSAVAQIEQIALATNDVECLCDFYRLLRIVTSPPSTDPDAVDDLSRVIAAAGYRVLRPPHRVAELGRYESVVVDPDGNRVKLTV